jgi:anti-sigma regulatory factor (Ser/Thr protein kinase)
MAELRTRSDRERPLVSLTLPGERSSARTARARLYEELDGRFPPSVLDNLVLIVSELVGNAAAATGEPVWLTVSCDDDILRVELHDGSDVLPQLDDRGAMAEDGRGLWLINALAVSWGVVRQPVGKMVWVTLRV